MPESIDKTRLNGAVLVMIVEDEEPIADTLAMVVSDAGFDLLRAANGRQALELLSDQRPALVITDLMMPFVDGSALIAQLRADAITLGLPRTPIILMTAAGTQRTKGIDADIIITKPFDIDQIDDLLQRFLMPETPRGC